VRDKTCLYYSQVAWLPLCQAVKQFWELHSRLHTEEGLLWLKVYILPKYNTHNKMYNTKLPNAKA